MQVENIFAICIAIGHLQSDYSKKSVCVIMSSGCYVTCIFVDNILARCKVTLCTMHENCPFQLFTYDQGELLDVIRGAGCAIVIDCTMPTRVGISQVHGICEKCGLCIV